jgi:hypothetical protein
MMWEGLFEQLPSLGVAGLLFVMWWQERQERLRMREHHVKSDCRAESWRDVTTQVLSVIQANTEALTALREELRSQRAADLECFARLTRQIERIEQTQ